MFKSADGRLTIPKTAGRATAPVNNSDFAFGGAREYRACSVDLRPDARHPSPFATLLLSKSACERPRRDRLASSHSRFQGTWITNGGSDPVGARWAPRASRARFLCARRFCKRPAPGIAWPPGQPPAGRHAPPRQTIVTRERTVYGRPIASMIKVASAASGPNDTNNTWS